MFGVLGLSGHIMLFIYLTVMVNCVEICILSFASTALTLSVCNVFDVVLSLKGNETMIDCNLCYTSILGYADELETGRLTLHSFNCSDISSSACCDMYVFSQAMPEEVTPFVSSPPSPSLYHTEDMLRQNVLYLQQRRDIIVNVTLDCCLNFICRIQSID